MDLIKRNYSVLWIVWIVWIVWKITPRGVWSGGTRISFGALLAGALTIVKIKRKIEMGRDKHNM
jgi:hypothetical protein